MFPLDGHEMNTGDALHLLELLDLFAGDLDAFVGDLFLIHALEAFDDFIGHIHAGHLHLHVARHTDTLHGRDAGQDVDLLGESHVNGFLDPLAHSFHVEDALGLDEIDAGGDFLGQAMDAPFVGLGKGVGRAADENLGGTVDVGAAEELGFVAHFFDGADQLGGVDVEDALGLGMVAELLMVAGEAEHVADAHGRGTEDVGLHGQPVAIPADHLVIGLEPLFDGDQRGRPAGHAHHGGLVVGDIDGIDLADQVLGLIPNRLHVGSAGRPQFSGEGEMTGAQYFFQIAS
ncbi:hypothetical protein DESC_610391 [Desulfosarcina cetonica]|nr:hypothetical protein DESC_610391 [Desulfosarcina cetonica]